MKKYLALFLIIIGLYANSFAQKQKESVETILEAPESWRKEIILFPLSFATEIDFKGFEDIRFAKGWADQTHEDFWTYTFVWCLDNDPQLNEEKLDQVMNTYFDGLMKVVTADKDLSADTMIKTNASFIKNSKKESYVGKVTVFDGFFSLKPIRLHVTTEQTYCELAQKYLVRFNLSPKGFDHEIWNSFDEVKIKLKCQ